MLRHTTCLVVTSLGSQGFSLSCCAGERGKNESESCSVVPSSLRPHGLYSPSNSPGQNTGEGSLSLLQEIFPTQGSNPGLPHCRWILYQLSYEGSLVREGITTLQCATVQRANWGFSLAVNMQEGEINSDWSGRWSQEKLQGTFPVWLWGCLGVWTYGQEQMVEIQGQRYACPSNSAEHGVARACHALWVEDSLERWAGDNLRRAWRAQDSLYQGRDLISHELFMMLPLLVVWSTDLKRERGQREETR